jgi:DNA polymerase I-like protein with 3'-5' exonuclease and polymerase domains
MIELQTETDLFGAEVSSGAKIDRAMLAAGLYANLKDISLEKFVSYMVSEFDCVVDYVNLCAGDKTGQRISLLFNPHRLDIVTDICSKESLFQALKREGWSRNLARVVILKKDTTKEVLYQSVGIGINGVSYVQEFPPHVARDLAKEYNLTKLSRVLDPCAGWGGRMIGFSTVVDSYTCCEPSTKTAVGLRKLHDWLRVFRSDFSATIHEAPFEDIELPPASFDFALTSPPYYDTERYADEPTNSFNRYHSFDDWCRGFYEPLIHRTMAALKPGAAFVLNIGSRVYPLNDRLHAIARDRYIVEKQKGKLSASNGLGKEGEGETFYEVRNQSGVIVLETVKILTPEPERVLAVASPVIVRPSALDFAFAQRSPDAVSSAPETTITGVSQTAPAAKSEDEAKLLRDALLSRGHRLLTKDGKFFVSESSRLTPADREAIKGNREQLIKLAEEWKDGVAEQRRDEDHRADHAEDSRAPAAGREELPAPLQPDVRRSPQDSDSLFADAPQASVTLAQFLGSESRPAIDYTPDDPPDLSGIDTLEFDTETDGLRWWETDRPIGLSCRRPDGSTFYLAWGHAGGNLDESQVKRWCERELRNKHLVGAGIKFDVNMMKSWGVDLEEQGCTVSDVQIYAALLDDSRKKFNLDILSKDFLGKEKTGRELDKTRMRSYHASEVAEYAKTDVALTGELRAAMMPLLDAEDLQRVRQLEDDVIYPVCEMERNGAPLDTELLERWVKESGAKYEECLWSLAKETGQSINPDVASDLEKLFEHLHLPIVRLPSGAPSFTDAILKRIDHPMIKQVRFATKLSDLRSRYLLKYQKAVSSDGILRYAMHQTRYQKDTGEEGGVGPGRFSSSELADGVGCNIQQVYKLSKQRKAFGYPPDDSAHDDEIHLIRKLMVPRDGQWLSADLMQVEFRLFSHYAGNQTLLQAYRDDPLMSFHDKAVEMVRPHYPDVIYDEQKNWTFAYLYGAKTIKQAVMMDFITEEEGDVIRKAKDWNSPKLARTAKIASAFNGAIPEAERLMKKCAKLAEDRGWIKTLKGRRSRFANGGQFHKSMNNLLQGGAADYMKEKLIEVHRARKSTGFLLRISVHDELDGDAREPETLAKVRAILDRQSWPELKVPLLWDIGLGKNWAEAK